MAEKGFGVKEVNLIGASGTPTITSPNNLNLNANNVAISTNVSIGGTLSVTGNVSVGGTLTYEDVTNIDSVGLITARTGVKLPDSQSLTLGTDDDAELKHTGANLVIRNTTGNIRIEPKNGQLAIQSTPDERTSIYFSGSKKFETTNTGVVVTGILTATTFSGSGASLTNVPAADPTATDVQVAYELLSTSASGAGWRITGNGIVNTVNNPDLYLIRGQKYRFINNSGGSHPFRIQSDSSTAYGTGVTNNNASSGNIDFVPRNDAPARLYYNCTSHGGMLGNIYLRGAGGNETNVGVTTFSGKVFIDRTHASATTGNHPALDIDTIANGTAGATFATGIDFRVAGVHKKRLVVTNADSSAGTGDWVFYRDQGNNEALRIDSGGRSLFKSDGSQTSPNADANVPVQVAESSQTMCYFGANKGNGYGSLFGHHTAYGGTVIRNVLSDDIVFYTNNTSAKMRIASNGNIGAPTGNNIYNASDERLKENMIELTDGLSKIQKLKPISFAWKKGWDINLDGKKEYGFGAQTTEAVDEILVEPFGSGDVELNGETIENPLRVNEKYIIPLLVKAIQELSAEVAALKAK